MKTAEELYNKILDDDEFKSFPDGLMCMGQFKKALADYKQSIIGIIDEMMNDLKDVISQTENYKDALVYTQGIISLGELKQKIEELC